MEDLRAQHEAERTRLLNNQRPASFPTAVSKDVKGLLLPHPTSVTERVPRPGATIRTGRGVDSALSVLVRANLRTVSTEMYVVYY